MNFRKSNLNDVNEIMTIINEAKDSIKNLKIDQWQDGYPNSKSIKDDIKNDYSYVLINNENIVATAAISFDGEKTYDKIYEGNWLSTQKFAVVHRVAASNSVRGLGISSILFKEVEKICLENHVNSIKVDTHEGNIPMQKFLLKNGYKKCGVIYIEDGGKRIAFEKII